MSGDKRPRLKSEIRFYEVEDDDNYDGGYEAVIHIKIDKASRANKHNTNKLTFPVTKHFYRKGPMVVHMLCKITVSVFKHLGITT